MYSFDALKVKDSCIRWIHSWFENNGKGCNAILGISGGKDSTVVASLLCEALGRDRVYGILMPNGNQSDIEDSKEVVYHLGCHWFTIDISDAFTSIYNSVRECLINVSDQTKINLPARIRMSALYAMSQSLNGRVANTCNLSEDYIGYSTRYGDSAGDFSPLANLTATEVIQIGDTLNLPYHLVHKAPSDGLCGKTDEDNLGFTYEVLDKYIRSGMIDDEDIKAKIDRLHHQNLFKMRLVPSFKYVD